MARTVRCIYDTVYRILEDDLDRKVIGYIKINIKINLRQIISDNVLARVGFIRVDHNFYAWQKRNSTEEYEIAYSIVNGI